MIQVVLKDESTIIDNKKCLKQELCDGNDYISTYFNRIILRFII